MAPVLTPFVLAGALAAATGVMTVPSEPGVAPTPFEQLLDRVPATALDSDGAMLLYVDMDLAWQRAGVGEAEAERLERIGALADRTTWTQGPQLFAASSRLVAEARAEVGFTMFDIEREVAVLAPPHDLMIADTDVTPDDIATVVELDPMWSAELELVDTPYGAYFQWGTDPAAVHADRISPLRPLGQGGQLTLLGGDTAATVARTIDAADAEAILSTAAGATDSLLDAAPAAAAVVAVADDGDSEVLQLIASAALAFATESVPADIVLLQPYDSIVIVDLYAGAQTTTKVLLVHADEAAAAANAALAERAIAEGVDPLVRVPLAELLPGAGVSVDGSVVVVTLPFEGAYQQAQRMLIERTLFPSG